MSLFCFHKWEVVGGTFVEIVDNNNSRIPEHDYTEIRFRCRKCNKLKIKRIEGSWTPKEIAKIYNLTIESNPNKQT